MISLSPVPASRYAKALDLKSCASLSLLQTELLSCKAKLNLLERWQLLHYKEAGFLGWVARFILNLLPSSQVRFKQLETLLLAEEIAKSATCTALLKREKTPLQTGLPKESRAKLADTLPHSDLKADNEVLIASQGVSMPITAILTKKAPSVGSLLKKYAHLNSEDYPVFKGDKKIAFDHISNLVRSNRLNPKLSTIDPGLLKDREFMLEVVKKAGIALKFAADHLKADREVVLAAVIENSIALQFAADYLKDDIELAFVAISHMKQKRNPAPNMYALKFIGPRLKADKEFLLAALEVVPPAMLFFSHEMRADKEIVLAAVKLYGLNLQWASADLRADKEVIEAAVAQKSSAIKYALA